MLHEIVLPETKPETEWVRGCPLQKVSPQRTHARLQLALGEKVRRPLVPDIAYVSNERLRHLSDDELECPRLAPDVAVEILSPDDRREDVDDKIGTYLRAGSSLVVIVDPHRRIVELHDRSGVAMLGEDHAIEHSALPGFAYPVSELFGVLRRA
jgi:Uma2 family endonuclease